MAQPNPGGTDDPVCAGTGILSWRKLKQYLARVLCQTCTPQRRWNSGLEEAAAGWVLLLNITSVFTSHITKPLLLKEWDYRRISSLIKRGKKTNKQKTQSFFLGMQGKSLDASLSLIKAQKPKEMWCVYNIYCFK